jgi:hypothetical protein
MNARASENYLAISSSSSASESGEIFWAEIYWRRLFLYFLFKFEVVRSCFWRPLRYWLDIWYVAISRWVTVYVRISFWSNDFWLSYGPWTCILISSPLQGDTYNILGPLIFAAGRGQCIAMCNRNIPESVKPI